MRVVFRSEPHGHSALMGSDDDRLLRARATFFTGMIRRAVGSGVVPTADGPVFAMAVPATPRGAKAALDTAEGLRAEGYEGPITFDEVLRPRIAASLFEVEFRWDLAEIVCDAREVRTLQRSTRQWAREWDGALEDGSVS